MLPQYKSKSKIKKKRNSDSWGSWNTGRHSKGSSGFGALITTCSFGAFWAGETAAKEGVGINDLSYHEELGGYCMMGLWRSMSRT